MDPLKKRFFRYHLTASITIILLVSAICQFLWFPQPFLQLDGTWMALLMLAGVDIIIGPLLTLLLVSIKKSKRELSLDMAVIVIIQISALTYGLMQIEKERLIALVHYDGVFHLVPQKILAEPLNNAKIIPTLNLYQGIPLVMISEQDVDKYTQQSQNKLVPFLYALENYQAIDIEELTKFTFDYKNLPEAITKRYGQEYIFKGITGKRRSAVIVFNQDMFIADIQLLPKADKYPSLY
jgi:hypothetical protein